MRKRLTKAQAVIKREYQKRKNAERRANARLLGLCQSGCGDPAEAGHTRCKGCLAVARIKLNNKKPARRL